MLDNDSSIRYNSDAGKLFITICLVSQFPLKQYITQELYNYILGVRSFLWLPKLYQV